MPQDKKPWYQGLLWKAVAIYGLAALAYEFNFKDRVLDEFKAQTKEITVTTNDGIEYIPTKEADSILSLPNFFEEYQENRAAVLEKGKIIGYKYNKITPSDRGAFFFK